MNTSQEVVEIFKALLLAQTEFSVALKDADNSFLQSKYADFESVIEAVKPALKKYKLGFTQLTRPAREGEGCSFVLVTRIFHDSGQWIEGEYPVMPSKNDPQSMGAAMTYSRRYALQGALGVVTSNEDDDAESAMDRQSGDRKASKAAIAGVMKAFASMNVSEAQVLKYLGAKVREDITEDDLSVLKQIGVEIRKEKSKIAGYFGEEKK